MNVLTSRPARVAGVVLIQFALVGAAVSGQLSARLTGDEYLFRVEPVDPIDPFRGAYVDLDYPDLASRDEGTVPYDDRDGTGDLFMVLEKDGKVWRAESATRDRPSSGPYLTCTDRDWQIKCGIESWFLPQEEALALEDEIRTGDVVARVRIDNRGHAALVAVEPR